MWTCSTRGMLGRRSGRARLCGTGLRRLCQELLLCKKLSRKLMTVVFEERKVCSPKNPPGGNILYFLQVMLESSVYLTLAVYSGCCLLAAVASFFLPIETKGRGLQESSHREWGQEMVGRGSHSPGVTRSNSGSQEWWDMKSCWRNGWNKQDKFPKRPTLKHRKQTILSLPTSCVKLQELLGWTSVNCVTTALCSHT